MFRGESHLLKERECLLLPSGLVFGVDVARLTNERFAGARVLPQWRPGEPGLSVGLLLGGQETVAEGLFPYDFNGLNRWVILFVVTSLAARAPASL